MYIRQPIKYTGEKDMSRIPVVEAILQEIKKYKTELATKTIAPGFDTYEAYQKAKGIAEGLNKASSIALDIEKRYIEGDDDAN
jgi:hypothetical protein